MSQIYRSRLIGKLQEISQEDAQLELFENCIPRIPFRILLREYAQWLASSKSSGSLFHYLASQISQIAGRNVTPETIQQIIKANASLLILDGLDEVVEKRLRRKVLDNIASCVDQIRDVLGGELKVIATTRPYGYSQEFDASQYVHLELQALESFQAERYAMRWSDVRESDLEENTRIKSSFTRCVHDSVISTLTQTPLQVTIILVLIRARGMPPKQREELFEAYMETIYQREQKKHPALLQTEKELIYGLHQYLAYILHKRAEHDETAVLMDISEFKREVEKFLSQKNPPLAKQEREEKVDRIISEAHQRLVLIESPVEGKVGFSLTSIREFFAAAHLFACGASTHVHDEQFKAIARSPHWRNVALFFAGRIGRCLPREAASMIDVCRSIDNEGSVVYDVEDFELLEMQGQRQHKDFARNAMFMKGVALLVLLSKNLEINRENWHDTLSEKTGDRDWFVNIVSFPAIVLGEVREAIHDYSDIVEEFCTTFSGEKDPFTSTLVKFFECFLQPENHDAFTEMVHNFRSGDEETQFILRRLSKELFNIEELPEDEKELREFGLTLSALSRRYKFGKIYKAELVELQKLLNQEISKISFHPNRLFLWLSSGSLPELEQFFDGKILYELKNYVENHDIPYTIFSLSDWSCIVISDLKLCELSLEILERQLTTQQRPLSVFGELRWYYELAEKESPIVPQKLKCIFEKILENANGDIDDALYYFLSLFYGILFKTDLIEEKHLKALYETVKDEPDFTPDARVFYPSMPDERLKLLLTMLNDEDVRIVRLTAASLNGIYEVLKKRRKKGWVSEMRVCEKLWEFAKNPEDPWQTRYIRNMAQFKLQWSAYANEWFVAMKNAQTKEIQDAWSTLIEKGTYLHDGDRDALFSLLLRILHDQNDFAPTLCNSVYQRLQDILPEVETLEFDEASLNLPL